MDLREPETPTSTADLANCPPRYFLCITARSLFCLDNVSVADRPEDITTLSLRTEAAGVAAAEGTGEDLTVLLASLFTSPISSRALVSTS
jgi:hypothetical protein